MGFYLKDTIFVRNQGFWEKHRFFRKFPEMFDFSSKLKVRAFIPSEPLIDDTWFTPMALLVSAVAHWTRFLMVFGDKIDFPAKIINKKIISFFQQDYINFPWCTVLKTLVLWKDSDSFWKYVAFSCTTPLKNQQSDKTIQF